MNITICHADTCGVISFTYTAQFALHFIGPLPSIVSAETSYEARERHQVPDTKERALFADDNFRIRCDQVRPLPRNRANALLVDLKQQSRTVPVVSLANAGELLSTERMERMRYSHKVRRGDGTVCILN